METYKPQATHESGEAASMILGPEVSIYTINTLATLTLSVIPGLISGK